MEEKKQEDEEFQELISSLRTGKYWEGTNLSNLYLYKNVWYPSYALKPVISFQKNFQAHQNDIILASIPKSGTTWLKAIIYLLKNRTLCPLNQSPLLTSNPHDLIPFFEFDIFMKSPNPDLGSIPEPRLFSTHIPYYSLPDSIIRSSKCKIVYVCRNPLDQFISYWHFLQKVKVLRRDSVPDLLVEEAFELHCNGVHTFGPFWNHMLEYWKASKENPDRVLFLKYEDLKNDVTSYTRKLAEFLGFPFSVEEKEEGVVEEICRICSFENLKSLEINKNGRRTFGAQNSSYFRKGEVGDWRNHLTPLMAEHMNKLLQEKLEGSSLSFCLSSITNKDS